MDGEGLGLGILFRLFILLCLMRVECHRDGILSGFFFSFSSVLNLKIVIRTIKSYYN